MNSSIMRFIGSMVFAFLMMPVLSAQEETSPGVHPFASEATDPAEKDKLLGSRRWQRLVQQFDDWMSVQVIYTDEEISAMKARWQDHINSMTAEELEDFMDDAELRMNLLLSDEVMEARSWLSFMAPQARREKISSHGELPDVFGMSIAQLRVELNQFQLQRAQRAAAQAAFDQSRQQRSAAPRQTQQAAPAPAPREAATFGSQPNFPTPPEPRKREIPQESPRFWVTPWGIAHPIY